MGPLRLILLRVLRMGQRDDGSLDTWNRAYDDFCCYLDDRCHSGCVVMLILHGKVSTLKGPWAQVEATSDARLEEITLHLIRWVTKRDEPAQILFPVASRDIGGIELLYPNILIRTKSDLTGLKSIMGVQGVTMDNNGHPLTLDNEYVGELIGQCEKASDSWSDDIEAGSFVRVLMGNERMLCGSVTKVKKGIAEVLVSLTVRNVRVRIPVKALLKLKVRKNDRRYYYTA